MVPPRAKRRQVNPAVPIAVGGVLAAMGIVGVEYGARRRSPARGPNRPAAPTPSDQASGPHRPAAPASSRASGVPASAFSSRRGSRESVNGYEPSVAGPSAPDVGRSEAPGARPPPRAVQTRRRDTSASVNVHTPGGTRLVPEEVQQALQAVGTNALVEQGLQGVSQLSEAPLNPLEAACEITQASTQVAEALETPGVLPVICTHLMEADSVSQAASSLAAGGRFELMDVTDPPSRTPVNPEALSMALGMGQTRYGTVTAQLGPGVNVRYEESYVGWYGMKFPAHLILHFAKFLKQILVVALIMLLIAWAMYGHPIAYKMVEGTVVGVGIPVDLAAAGGALMRGFRHWAEDMMARWRFSRLTIPRATS